ncbi:MAG TPA: DNA alkylation repair protein [Dehalococcoidales bacterium]|nr:DNA alkylation repair protein [Dehalococcoidales bacterium]
MPQDALSLIRAELQQKADPVRAESEKRYFKEPIKSYGLSMPASEKLARAYFPSVKPFGKKAVLALCEELFASGYSEECFIACDWAYSFRKEFEESDFATFERWISKYVTNWAVCDTLCNHTVAALVEKYPKFLADLKRWAKSDNRWFRRAAAVTLVLPARRGLFLPDIFQIADILLTDADDLVQKGYGWMLKEASKPHQSEVFDYVMKHKSTMPRTALRYAIEKLPPELKRRAMER